MEMLSTEQMIHQVVSQRKAEDQRSTVTQEKASATATDPGSQEFWLTNLREADAFTTWVVDEISPWLGKNVLEVGCGIGTYTGLLAKLSDRVTGLDCEERFVNEARRRLKEVSNVTILRGDVTSKDCLQLGRSGFDTVILLDVLEHIQYDFSLLIELYDYLAPGGQLILKVPGITSLMSSMDRAIGHWRRYSKTSLASVVRQAGFEVVDLRQFNAFAVPGWWLNGRVLRRRVPPAGQIAAFNRIVPLIRRVDRVAARLCGISLLCVGRRPLGVTEGPAA
jgi:2-polyprenyl-3-methyl-5-hydroxy-6-metoxy-1,4-benzoquinol methylase